MSSPLLGLAMIVRDDADVLEATLERLTPFIDCWWILDLGSTDGTQELIGRRLRGLPGTVEQTGSTSVGTSQEPAAGKDRTDERPAVGQAEPAFVIYVDPDELLRGGEDLRTFLELERDPNNHRVAYELGVEGLVSVDSVRVVRTPVGGMREVASMVAARRALPPADGRIPGAGLVCGKANGNEERARRRLKRDLALLEAAVSRRPHDARAMLALGITQYRMGFFPQAVATLEKRVRMDGPPLEVFEARLLCAQAGHAAHEDWPHVLEQYLRAYASAPERPEPFYHIAMHYASEPPICFLFARRAQELADKKLPALQSSSPIDTAKLESLVALCGRLLGETPPEPAVAPAPALASRPPKRRKRS